MSDKKTDFRKTHFTQLDPGQVLKGSFSDYMSALRTSNVNTILSDAYTDIVMTTDAQGRPLTVEYYQAGLPSVDSITVTADVSSSHVGFYIQLQEYTTKLVHEFFFKVAGVGTNSGTADVYHQIDILENDPASVVCFALKEKLDTLDEFVVLRKGIVTPSLELTYNQFGNTDAINLGNTNFSTVRLSSGESTLVGDVTLSYDSSGNVIYNNNTYLNMAFNPYTASFEIIAIPNSLIDQTKDALKVVDVVEYDRLEIAYDVNSNITQVRYFRDEGAGEIQFKTISLTYDAGNNMTGVAVS